MIKKKTKKDKIEKKERLIVSDEDKIKYENDLKAVEELLESVKSEELIEESVESVEEVEVIDQELDVSEEESIEELDELEDESNQLEDELKELEEDSKELAEESQELKESEEVIEDTVDATEEVTVELQDLEEETEELTIDQEVAQDLGILSKEEKWNKRKKTLKKIGMGFLALIILVLTLYLSGAYYFNTHFYYNTTVNGVDVSLKNTKDGQELLKDMVSEYEMSFTLDEEVIDSIQASEIALEYIESSEVPKFIKKQNIWEWPLMFLDKSSFEFDIELTFDEELLNAVVAILDCSNIEEDAIIKSANAYPALDGKVIKIVEEEYGNVLVEDFIANIQEKILAFSDTFDMKDGGFSQPKYTVDSPEVITAKELMETYMDNTITYSEGDVIDGEQIAKWMKVDKNELGITFDEDAIKEYVKKLATKYNTVGATRTFNNPDGKQVSVSGGTYGWTVNQSTEVEKIISDIQGSEAVTRSLEYSKKGAAHGDADWGTTFAMIDLTNQKMWMVVDGEVVVSSSVVTGSVADDNATPQGVYSVSYTTKNATLRGAIQPDGTRAYETPVAYWMPFNGGIGFHDATWRSSFGGTIYKNSGSHGCINMPLDKAKQLYRYLKAGMPVICHY